MDVVLQLTTPRVKLVSKSGVSISRDELLKLAGFNATTKSGESLMDKIHLGADGLYDTGYTPISEEPVSIPVFFKAGGKFYNTGKQIVVEVEFEKDEVDSETEFPSLGDFEELPVMDEVIEDIEAPVKMEVIDDTLKSQDVEDENTPEISNDLNLDSDGNIPLEDVVEEFDPNKAILTEEDENTQTYELSYSFGDEPGMYRIPDFHRELELPKGKRLISATLVAFATDIDGDVIRDIQLAEENYYDTNTIDWVSPFEDELPFGLDDGSGVYGLWYAIYVNMENIPEEPKKSAWGGLANLKKKSDANTDTENISNLMKDPVGTTQQRKQEELDGPQNIWSDSESDRMPNMDELGGLSTPDLNTDEIDLMETRKIEPIREPENEINFGIDMGEPSVPVLSEEDEFYADEDLDGQVDKPKSGKSKLFDFKKKQKSKPVTKSEKVAKKKPEKSSKNGGNLGLIGLIIGFAVLMCGLAGGGIYYTSGVNSVKPLAQEIRNNNNEIKSYLDKDELSSQDSTELAALVQKNDTAFENFKPSNFFAQNEENKLITETQGIIDQVYAKVNK